MSKEAYVFKIYYLKYKFDTLYEIQDFCQFNKMQIVIKKYKSK